MNANADADYRGSTIVLCELCSGELKIMFFIFRDVLNFVICMFAGIVDEI